MSWADRHQRLLRKVLSWCYEDPRDLFHIRAAASVEHTNAGLPPAQTRTYWAGSAWKKVVTQLEQWQRSLWDPLSLSLLFIRSSSSAGEHQQKCWMTHTGSVRHGHTFSRSHNVPSSCQGHKVSVGAELSDSSYQRAVKWKLDSVDDLASHYPQRLLQNVVVTHWTTLKVARFPFTGQSNLVLLLCQVLVVCSRSSPLLYFLVPSHLLTFLPAVWSPLVQFVVYLPVAMAVFSVVRGNPIRPIKS